MTEVYIIGSKGKMGSRVAALAENHPDFRLVSAWEEARVAIDFTAPGATKQILNEAVLHKIPLVMGTTGHPAENVQAIQEAAKKIPLLYSPNFSLGMTACLEAVSLLAQKLGSLANIEIVEAHHTEKKDKPSGTALALAKATGKEPPIHSIRAGDIVGDHTVIFALGGERIEIKHQAHSRDAFALGAILSAQFLLGKEPGLYTLKDVFL